MSVIWSGVTEEGAIVPVQVTAEGKVVAVGDGPEGEYLKLTGGNLTGDLTVNERIELKTDGSATFAGSVVVSDGTSLGCILNKAGVMTLGRATSGSTGGTWTFLQQATINNTPQPSLLSLKAFDGSMRYAIDASGNQFIGTALETSPPNISLNVDGSATFAGQVSTSSSFEVRRSNGEIAIDIGLTGVGTKARVNADGSCSFSGDACGFTSGGELFFTSRNARYKLVVSNGLCSAEPYTRQMELKERAEQFTEGKIEPKDEVTTDNDNA